MTPGHDDETVLDADRFAPSWAPGDAAAGDDATMLDRDRLQTPSQVPDDETLVIHWHLTADHAAPTDDADADGDVTLEPAPPQDVAEGDYWQPNFNRRIKRVESSLPSARRVVPLADDSEHDDPEIAPVADLGDGWALSHVDVRDAEMQTDESSSFDAVQLATLALILIALVLVVLVILRLT